MASTLPVFDLSTSGRADAGAMDRAMTPLPTGGAHHDLVPGEHLMLRATNTRWRARVLTVRIRAQDGRPWRAIRIKRHGTITVAWSIDQPGRLAVISDKPGVDVCLIRMPPPGARLTMTTMSPGLGPQPPMEMSWTMAVQS
jgi:hypothetical protein